METAELTAKLISFNSLTPSDDGAFDFITSYLNTFEAIRIDVEGVKNLFLYKNFSSGLHLNFAGHIDVVPAGEGWNSDPFIATEVDGNIYGRGASDMKGGMAAFINAIKNTESFNGTLSIMLTSDEEGDAVYGTVEILKKLSKENLLPDICLVAEPTCDKEFGDTIKVGRRGSINGKITIIGRGGHAAYPQKAINPISLVGKLLPLLADKKLDSGDEYFSPSQLVITDIRGGYQKTNVIPTELTLMFNVRNSTNTGIDEIKDFIESKAKECGIENIRIEIDQSSKPFIAQKSNFAQQTIALLSQTVENHTGIKPCLSTSGGTSDARFIAECGIDVVEFGPLNETIHAPNERVSKNDLVKLESIFTHFIKQLSDIKK